MRFDRPPFVSLVLAQPALPALAGYAVTGTLAGALTGLLWGGLVRIFLVHHVTWSVNSVCHFLGTRRFDTDDESTQRLLARAPLAGRVLAPQPPRLPPLGLPRPKRWELDPSGLDPRAGEAGPGAQRGPISPERQAERSTRESSHHCTSVIWPLLEGVLT